MHSNKQAGKHIGPHLYQLKPIGLKSIEINIQTLCKHKDAQLPRYTFSKTAQVSKFSIHKSLR